MRYRGVSEPALQSPQQPRRLVSRKQKRALAVIAESKTEARASRRRCEPRSQSIRHILRIVKREVLNKVGRYVPNLNVQLSTVRNQGEAMPPVMVNRKDCLCHGPISPPVAMGVNHG
jgi:hypothetical protein